MGGDDRPKRICEAIMCDKPSGDGILCRDCLKVLQRVLAEVPWLLHELDVAEAKESKFAASGDKVTTIGASLPMPIDLSAVDARRILTERLALWTADLSRSASVAALGALSAKSASAWLMRHLERIRTFEAAGDLHEELCAARATAKYVIDRPAERRYLGECGATFSIDEAGTQSEPCTDTLWGRQGDEYAYCKTCGAEWLMEPRLERIQSEAMNGMDDRIMTATQSAETLVAFGVVNDTTATRLRDQITKWAERKQLTARIDLPLPGERSRPGYRFGDVLALVLEAAERKRTKRRSA